MLAPRPEPSVAVERCDLAEIAGSAADALRPVADAHEVQVKQHLEQAMIDGDSSRLGQIVTNLLTNAIKFTPPGGRVELTVRHEAARRIASVTVSDNGPGIALEDRAHIFERFYRGESTRPMAGSGIGLAVVAQLTKAHGGKVELVDTPSGTTIGVSFPSI